MYMNKLKKKKKWVFLKGFMGIWVHFYSLRHSNADSRFPVSHSWEKEPAAAQVTYPLLV